MQSVYSVLALIMATSFDEMVTKILSVLGIESLSDEVMTNLKDEGITLQNLKFLDDADLRELGFLMGPRKQLLAWSSSQAVSPAAPTISMNTTAVNPSAQVPLTSTNFQNFGVDNLVSQVKGVVSGEALVSKLKNGEIYTRQERIFLVKTVGKYLMSHCRIPDKPSKEEKADMAQSIVTVFPVLKDASAGFGEFYDPKSHTGHLEYYIRCRRSRNVHIETPSRKKKDNAMQYATHEEGDDVRMMRERRPNAANRCELLELMEKTRLGRRSWIDKCHPTITDILHKYPRFQDMDDAIVEEFRALHPDSKVMLSEWQAYKDRILEAAESYTTTLPYLEQVDEQSDDDMRSKMAFLCLLAMLPTPPKRGIKRPKTTPQIRSSDFFVDFQEATVDDCLLQLRETQVTQPVLFLSQQQYCIKADNTALMLPGVGGFVEAVERLFMVFFVFSIHYPESLRVFYNFLEAVMGIGGSKQTPMVRDLLRKINN